MYVQRLLKRGITPNHPELEQFSAGTESHGDLGIHQAEQVDGPSAMQWLAGANIASFNHHRIYIYRHTHTPYIHVIS